MDRTQTEILLHPVRLLLVRLLANQPMTTQEIGQELPDVPNSSIYRHLKKLLDVDVIEIAETRMINGIQERTYRLKDSLAFNGTDQRGIEYTKEEHLKMFTTYAASLIQGFSEYLEKTEDGKYYDDRMGYSHSLVYATREEIDTFGRDLTRAFEKLANNEKLPGRRLFKIALINHPLESFDYENGEK